jgi:hypothetical protein
MHEAIDVAGIKFSVQVGHHAVVIGSHGARKTVHDAWNSHLIRGLQQVCRDPLVEASSRRLKTSLAESTRRADVWVGHIAYHHAQVMTCR